MSKHKQDVRRGLPPSNNGKARPKDTYLCHFCGEDLDYKTAWRIPAYDIRKNGSYYLVHPGENRGLPVMKEGV